MLNCHDTLKEFPRGAYTAALPEPIGRVMRKTAWGGQPRYYPISKSRRSTIRSFTMVFLGTMESLEARYNEGGDYGRQIAHRRRNHDHHTFLCPSADLPTTMPNGGYFGLPSDPVTTGYGTSHYKASRGYCDRGMFLRKSESIKPQTLIDMDFDGDGTLDRVDKEPFTRVRIQDVLDGTSKTIAIGEAAYFVDSRSFPIWIGTVVEDGAILFQDARPICFGRRHFRYPTARFNSSSLRTVTPTTSHTAGTRVASISGLSMDLLAFSALASIFEPTLCWAIAWMAE